jgi:hypothetical protein
MDAFTVTSTLAGIALVGLVLLDVTLAVLHLDASGRLGSLVQRGVWRASMATSRRWPASRGRILAAAGPAMVVATYVVWIALFILGFALIYWPFLDRFRAADAVWPLGFVDALYFSGSTGTVLGFGDVTPLTWGLRVVAVAQAALGFALLTATVTYLITIVSGVTERNTLAVRVRDETGGTGDGVELILRSLATESLDDTRNRLLALAGSLRSLAETMQQFPVLDLFYRSRDPLRDVEPMLRALVDAALTARVAVQDPSLQRLGLVTEELDAAVGRTMRFIAAQYLPARMQGDLDDPRPGDEDWGRVDAIRARLNDRLPAEIAFASTEARTSAAEQASRSRRFFEELERVTGASR